jgi:hypothetical protein
MHLNASGKFLVLACASLFWRGVRTINEIDEKQHKAEDANLRPPVNLQVRGGRSCPDFDAFVAQQFRHRSRQGRVVINQQRMQWGHFRLPGPLWKP